MKVLFRILMGIAVISGYNLWAASIAVTDTILDISYVSIAEGTNAAAFTASIAGDTATFTSTLAANTTTAPTTFTAANAALKFGLVSNDADGFVVTLTSKEDSNFMEADGTTGVTCLNETGTGDGSATDSDGLCITYDIVCAAITHDETNGAASTTAFDGTGSAGGWSSIQSTGTPIYTTVTNEYPGLTNYTDGTLLCDMKFAANEDIEEVAGGAYTDTITVTYSGN